MRSKGKLIKISNTGIGLFYSGDNYFYVFDYSFRTGLYLFPMIYFPPSMDYLSCRKIAIQMFDFYIQGLKNHIF